jgi:hypothetical protein
MTGMVFLLVGDPEVVAEAAAVVLEAVGVVMAVMVLTMVPGSFLGPEERGNSGWIYMSSSLPLALS